MASGADKKVKEMKKQLDNAVKKDELNAAISDNISRLRDEILSFIK